jgi:acetyl esterase/lipase
MKTKTTLLFCLLLISVTSAQQPLRYLDSLFVVQQTDENRVYARAAELTDPYLGESSTHMTDLTLHIFQPQADTLEKRPVLICAHGGAFVSGNKEHDDMLRFCTLFAEKGYVTATIEYRLGMNYLSPTSGNRAVYRGVQDSRAAIRYIKAHATELGADTSRVYVLGSSAGGFMALHNVFMNREDERPAGTYKIDKSIISPDNGPDLGGLDAIGEAQQHDGRADAIVSLWGALGDTLYIQPEDIDVPVLLVHGTADEIVPFGVDSPFNLGALPPVYGSYPVHLRLQHLAAPHETFFVEDVGHEFYGTLNGNWIDEPNAYWDSVTTRITRFLHQHHKPTADFHYTTDGNTVRFYDESKGAEHWVWDFGDRSSSFLQNPVHTYRADSTYKVTLTIRNAINSPDTTSQMVTVTRTNIHGSADASVPADVLSQNHPNPFNDATIIPFFIKKTGPVRLRVVNLQGQVVRSLLHETKHPGQYAMVWKGRNDQGVQVPSGVYYYRLVVDDRVVCKKMVLLR